MRKIEKRCGQESKQGAFSPRNHHQPPMKNGTEKQIEWALKMKTELLERLEANPLWPVVGSDQSFTMAIPWLANSGLKKMEISEARSLISARKSRLREVGGAGLRQIAVVQLKAIDDAQWWIENRDSDPAVLALSKIIDSI